MTSQLELLRCCDSDEPHVHCPTCNWSVPLKLSYGTHAKLAPDEALRVQHHHGNPTCAFEAYVARTGAKP